MFRVTILRWHAILPMPSYAEQRFSIDLSGVIVE